MIYRLLALTFLITVSSPVFAKQIIECINPELKITFDEKNMLDLKKTSYIESNLSLKGRITQIVANIQTITFIKTDLASSQLIIPREVQGKSLPYFQGTYSNVTQSTATPSQMIECSSVVK